MKAEPAKDAAADTHAVQLTAWDVPTATVAGEHFTAAIGARCSAGCDLGGRDLILFDDGGAPAARVKLGREVWPGTEALYFAKVEVKAPLESGTHQWEAMVTEGNMESPHVPGSLPVVVRVVSPPDCEVTVTAIDRETQTPIKGARVVIHPYRAVTDENGMARVRVARGQYDILVSGRQYLAACTSVEVTADLVTCAELDADQPPEEMLE